MTVFANGLEVACRAQSNKVIAAFPYVCMTPPQTPATPPGVPVPYPTFGLDSDTDKGTGTVKIGGETVTQKNLSYYTKCTGNEAGCAPMKNVVSHVNTGKEYAHAWSGDVKMDGEPVSRVTDISTNDHASPGSGGPPWPKIAKVNIAGVYSTTTCLVGPYNKIKDHCEFTNPKTGRKIKGEAHHIMPDMTLRAGPSGGPRIPGAPSHGEGIAICLPLSKHKGLHGKLNKELHKLGKKGRKLRRPVRGAKAQKDTASVTQVANTSAKSLDQVPGLPAACKAVAKKMMKESVAGIGRQPARTDPYRAPKKNSNLQSVLRRGKF